jgi:hypothetical protein
MCRTFKKEVAIRMSQQPQKVIPYRQETKGDDDVSRDVGGGE